VIFRAGFRVAGLETVEAISRADDPKSKGRRVIKRSIAAFVVALMTVPFFGGVASAQPDRVACLFYQTFREREITDCL